MDPLIFNAYSIHSFQDPISNHMQKIMDTRRHGQTDTPKPICPLNFEEEVGGDKNKQKILMRLPEGADFNIKLSEKLSL